MTAADTKHSKKFIPECLRFSPFSGFIFKIQGNMDPTILLTTPAKIRSYAAKALDSVADKRGYIFNIGHGVIKETPEQNVKTLVDFVHRHQ